MSLISTDRVFGHYPISIATSLAIEGLLHSGEFASDNTKTVYDKYQKLLVNVRTLFRNVFYAFEEQRDKLTPEVMVTCIMEDILGITRALKEPAPHLVVEPYICTFTTVNRKFPEAKFKNPTTPGQHFYNALEHDTYKLLDEQTTLVKFDVELKGSDDTLILTNMAIDLLSRDKFPKLALLESHTGKIKLHSEWYTKLNDKPEKIPFCKATLQLFGDGSTFSPQDLKVRKVLLKIADKYNWNQGTTWDRIYNCLRIENEPMLSEFLRRLAR